MCVCSPHLCVAEIVSSVGGGKVKKPRFHARGRMGMVTRPKTYLRIVLTEIPFTEGEKRLGRVGPVHKEWRETYRAQKREELSLRKSFQKRQRQKAARLVEAEAASKLASTSA
jgi:hypothetical protein